MKLNLGTVGGQEDDVIADGVIYADPKECEELVKQTGIDCLAPALGSVHGPYKGEPNLGFKEMEEISKCNRCTTCASWWNWNSNEGYSKIHFFRYSKN